MLDIEKVIDKIKKLLSLATSPNEHEAARAAERAHELLVKHNLDMQQVENRPDPEYVKHRISERVYQRVEEKFVLQILRDHFFVHTYQSRPQGDGYPYTTKIFMVGTKSNVQIAAYVHGFLISKFRELWLVYKRQNQLGENLRQSYYLGLTRGLLDKLESQKNRIQNERGLVLVKDPQLEKIIDDMKLGKAGSTRMQIRDWVMQDGIDDGKKIQIQRSLTEQADVGGKVLSIEYKGGSK